MKHFTWMLAMLLGLILAWPAVGLPADPPPPQPRDQKDQKDHRDLKDQGTASPTPPGAGEIVYKPPKRGAPGGRVGGGTRGTDQTFTLSVLAPTHTGLTLQEQPVLYWYLSKPFSAPIEFTLTDDSIKPLIETRISPPFQSGVQRVRLADYGVRLAPGKRYRWFVALVVDPERRSKDILAGGTIERAASSETLSTKLGSGDKKNAAYIYAESGFWYDAIAALSELVEAAPRDVTLHQERASLLEQAGLPEIAEYDLRAVKAE